MSVYSHSYGIKRIDTEFSLGAGYAGAVRDTSDGRDFYETMGYLVSLAKRLGPEMKSEIGLQYRYSRQSGLYDFQQPVKFGYHLSGVYLRSYFGEGQVYVQAGLGAAYVDASPVDWSGGGSVGGGLIVKLSRFSSIRLDTFYSLTLSLTGSGAQYRNFYETLCYSYLY